MTLRDDVRSAFERRQSELGDVSEASGRLMQAAMANQDRSQPRQWQWAAGVAAMLIAAIVVTTFALVRANTHPTPAPARTPSPRADRINVPDSTPLIVYHDAANFDQLDGVTWDGQTSGRIGLGAASGGSANLQGTLYQNLAGELRNRSGDLLAPKGFGDVFWADDGTHFCTMVRSGFTDAAAPGVLWLGEFGQTNRRIAQLGSFGSAGSNAGGPVVAACSPGGDRAVVYQAGGDGVGVAQFWVVQLSTGHILWQGGSGGSLAASHDGRYVALAENGNGSFIYGPNGEVLYHSARTVYAFSWTGGFAVVAGTGGSPQITYWIAGELTIWTCPPGISYQYWQAFPEPGGTRIAIGAFNPAYKITNGFQPVDLFVVDTNGKAGFEKKNLTLFQY